MSRETPAAMTTAEAQVAALEAEWERHLAAFRAGAIEVHELSQIGDDTLRQLRALDLALAVATHFEPPRERDAG